MSIPNEPGPPALKKPPCPFVGSDPKILLIVTLKRMIQSMNLKLKYEFKAMKALASIPLQRNLLRVVEILELWRISRKTSPKPPVSSILVDFQYVI